MRLYANQNKFVSLTNLAHCIIWPKPIPSPAQSQCTLAQADPSKLPFALLTLSNLPELHPTLSCPPATDILPLQNPSAPTLSPTTKPKHHPLKLQKKTHGGAKVGGLPSAQAASARVCAPGASCRKEGQEAGPQGGLAQSPVMIL